MEPGDRKLIEAIEVARIKLENEWEEMARNGDLPHSLISTSTKLDELIVSYIKLDGKKQCKQTGNP